MTLDHIIKERYPTFADALRDLDDALTMLFLFANLPSTTAVPPKTIALCQRLTLEFEHYLISARCLRKSFLSIKGIYYQAEIQGQEILWLVPYKFVQNITGDVDLRIMGTFIEFYTTLLGFVNFRLYTSIGLVYPPKFNSSSDDRGGDLDAFTLEGVALKKPDDDVNSAIDAKKSNPEASRIAQAEADKLIGLADPEKEEAEETEKNEESGGLAKPATEAPVSGETFDRFEPVAEDADILPQPEASSANETSIFEPFTFYLSRETPRGPLEFLLKAFGCKRVGWDSVLGDGAFTNDELDTRITHQIVDRPLLPSSSISNGDAELKEDGHAKQTSTASGARVLGRTYVQPQWVWDSINAGKLQRPDLYAPGATLPPHLSPWVKAKKGQYDPTIPLAEQEPEGEAERALEEENDKKAAATTAASTNGTAAAEDEWGGFDETEVDNVNEEKAGDQEDELDRQRELEAEAAGLPYQKKQKQNGTAQTKNEEARRKRIQRQREETEELERQRMMMSSKKRKMLDRMMSGNSKRNAEAEKLRAKKRRLEAAKK